MNHRFKRIKRCLEEIVDRLGTLGTKTNRNWVDKRRLGDGVAYGDPVYRPIFVCRQYVYYDNSDEEDDYKPIKFNRHQWYGGDRKRSVFYRDKGKGEVDQFNLV
ncbi:hypothetical protein GH714_015362 [Hevea brasiliensis]|uniref:Uncharacterized protein n=1 Tax=Hevea brasiliensis TaxID=3981 RepID=A0A6A6NHD9_HEVBR|nr:hypothetical protein GH714_015362 [Hevea brasiliensis]